MILGWTAAYMSSLLSSDECEKNYTSQVCTSPRPPHSCSLGAATECSTLPSEGREWSSVSEHFCNYWGEGQGTHYSSSLQCSRSEYKNKKNLFQKSVWRTEPNPTQNYQTHRRLLNLQTTHHNSKQQQSGPTTTNRNKKAIEQEKDEGYFAQNMANKDPKELFLSN